MRLSEHEIGWMNKCMYGQTGLRLWTHALDVVKPDQETSETLNQWHERPKDWWTMAEIGEWVRILMDDEETIQKTRLITFEDFLFLFLKEFWCQDEETILLPLKDTSARQWQLKIFPCWYTSKSKGERDLLLFLPWSSGVACWLRWWQLVLSQEG